MKDFCISYAEISIFPHIPLNHKKEKQNSQRKTERICGIAKSITSTNYMFHIHNNEYNNSLRGAFLDKTAFLQYKERKKAKENLCSLIKTTLKQG